MNRRLRFPLFALFLASIGLASAVRGESSHARIVRLSLVQGDVRFATSFHDDPLTDAKADWQVAPLNLPVRQGYVVATDNGRAEVEFEHGAMVFLGANTVLEFYDLSLQDGAVITRLVLRQGTATSYVNPARSDYFSLTGGDFTVEASSRTTFRLNNFDDGSTVSVEQGRANVLRGEQTTQLSKGQSLSIRVNDPDNVVIARAADPDDFDRWVSGRVETSVTATNYSTQYTSSGGYTAGFADLYTYGSWFPMTGYGYCWRPFGVGFGWSPFSYGSWYNDPSIGYTFIGSAPWGWLPYHYGGWVFSPVYGWVWAPVGFGGAYGGGFYYRPATAVWVRNGSTIGIVPLHPGDKYGKTAQNLNRGIYPVENSHIRRTSIAADTGKWSVLRKVSGSPVTTGVTSSGAPNRVSSTMVAAGAGNRVVNFGRNSSIVYDPVEHRYVNSGSMTAVQRSEIPRQEAERANSLQPEVHGATGREVSAMRIPGRAGVPQTPSAPRMATPPRAPAVPAPPRGGYSAGSGRGVPTGGTATWGGRGTSSGGSHPSFGGGSSGAHPTPSGGGGAHPH